MRGGRGEEIFTSQRRTAALALLLLHLLGFLAFLQVTDAVSSIGVCYGRQADNLPTPQQAVQLMQSQGISRVRLFSPDADALQALGSSQLEVIVGVPNTEIPSLAQSQAAALNWITTNISPYLPSTRITAIAVGSEIFTSAQDGASYLLPAMQNLYASLRNTGLEQQIKISTPHAMGVLANSFPPSSSRFDSRFTAYMLPILDFLSKTGSVFMINAYPYYAYRNNVRFTSLDFALLKQTTSGFLDPNTGLQYTNLLDAQLDAVFFALAAANYPGLGLVVTETGWPSMGDAGETNVVNLENAATYNNNLVRVSLDGNGTPYRPGVEVDVYIFELFNEDQRPGPTTNRNWGLFRPDGSKFYSINFGGGSGGSGYPGIIELNRTFCVASADANFNTLQSNLDWVCGQINVDCTPVQPGGRCYQPDTVASHASYVFNEFFQLNGMNPNACTFSGSAVITYMDPSYRKCIYLGSVKRPAGSDAGRGRSEHLKKLLITGVVMAALVALLV